MSVPAPRVRARTEGDRDASRIISADCATLCYMDERQVGVRELRQNLSKYLRRVERGERLEVTEHGRPIAVLTPLGEADTPLARLIAAGRVMPPTRAHPG